MPARQWEHRRGGAGGTVHPQEGGFVLPGARGGVLSPPGDLAFVGFYDKPLLKFERILESYLGVTPKGFIQFLKASPVWMKEKLFLDRELRRSLGGTRHRSGGWHDGWCRCSNHLSTA
jgi:hypothetical protein